MKSFSLLSREEIVSISKNFLFSDASSLSDLSYFITHCLFTRHPSGVFRRAEPSQINPSIEVQNSNLSHSECHLGGGSGHSRGHRRLDSEERVMGVRQPQPKKIIGDFPLTVIFTTSGAPSTPLPFFPVGKALPGKTQLTLRKKLSQYNGQYSVYQGDLDGFRVVVKITEDGTLAEALHHEASIYDHLCDLQGFVIPTFQGLFIASGSSLLITADSGESVTSFSALSNAQRYV